MSQPREPGSIIDNRYRLDEVLGSGGSGTVYKAYDSGLQRDVAVKLLNLSNDQQSDTRARFERESKALSQMLQPNIVRVFRFGVLEDESPFLVMEYLTGRSLRSLLDEKKRLSCHEAVLIAQQISSALEYAHAAKIVHRDLKPENIIVNEAGSMGLTVKIIDFGLCKQIDNNETLTRTGFLIGTAMYMSPEQCMGKETDWRTDIYSFGCVLFELITGQPPFTGDSHASILLKQLSDPMPSILELSPDSKLPAELQELILGCGKKKKEERYQSFAEIQMVLKEIEALKSLAVFTPVSELSLEGRSKRALKNLPRLPKKFLRNSAIFAVLASVSLLLFLFCSDSGNEVLTSQLQSSSTVDDAISNLTLTAKQFVANGKIDTARRIARQSSTSRKFKSWAALDREKLLQNYIDIFTSAKQESDVFYFKLRLLQELMESMQSKLPTLTNPKKRGDVEKSEEQLLNSLCNEFLAARRSEKEWTQISQAIESRWAFKNSNGPLILWILRCESGYFRGNLSEDDTKHLAKKYEAATGIASNQGVPLETIQLLAKHGLELGAKSGAYNRMTLIHMNLGTYYLHDKQVDLAREELVKADEAAEGHALSRAERARLEFFREECRIGKLIKKKKWPFTKSDSPPSKDRKNFELFLLPEDVSPEVEYPEESKANEESLQKVRNNGKSH